MKSSRIKFVRHDIVINSQKTTKEKTNRVLNPLHVQIKILTECVNITIALIIFVLHHLAYDTAYTT